ncbi:lipocalin family protein [Antarcticibacterium sp. 1MA-6-2]|uniref:lipocalin family protein n=1 Tax=Antarcticibacterium sp. 1MA-6-2 TaxID=2908210 RepID=UPI001F394176|nr:lipocalin family protein [Antarcticibacterium sp. 1MA-6-2]UJH92239.1 lipocalin family protein [Antarcticibacterium sp. 1MA-6-2]
MKKFLVLFLSLAVFAACSEDDDDTDATGPDPILGTWVLVNVTPPLIDVTACEQESTITFKPDNTGTGSFYLEANECAVTESAGSWTNNGNSSYQITVPVLGNITGTANFDGDEFIFTSNMGVLTFEQQ